MFLCKNCYFNCMKIIHLILMAKLYFILLLLKVYLVYSSNTIKNVLKLYDTVDNQPQFKLFWDWVHKHNIVPQSINQFNHIFNNWIDNNNIINEINDRKLSYRLGHNIYSGMNLKKL